MGLRTSESLIETHCLKSRPTRTSTTRSFENFKTGSFESDPHGNRLEAAQRSAVYTSLRVRGARAEDGDCIRIARSKLGAPKTRRGKRIVSRESDVNELPRPQEKNRTGRHRVDFPRRERSRSSIPTCQELTSRLVRGALRGAPHFPALASKNCFDAFLLTNAETLKKIDVPCRLMLLQVIEQTATATDQGQQTATGRKVFFVRAKMSGQIVDPLCQYRNLHICRAGVAIALLVLFDQFLLPLNRNCHGV